MLSCRAFQRYRCQHWTKLVRFRSDQRHSRTRPPHIPRTLPTSLGPPVVSPFHRHHNVLLYVSFRMSSYKFQSKRFIFSGCVRRGCGRQQRQQHSSFLLIERQLFARRRTTRKNHKILFSYSPSNVLNFSSFPRRILDATSVLSVSVKRPAMRRRKAMASFWLLAAQNLMTSRF